MSQNTLLPDDPKITAYALGELEADERVVVEAALRENPALRALVEEIRATAVQLTAALAAESAPEIKPAEMPPARATAIIPGRDAHHRDGGPQPYGGKRIKFPQFYYIVGLGAAACFAVIMALREPTHYSPKQTEIAAKQETNGEKFYTAVDLGAEPAGVSASSPAKADEAPGPVAMEAPAVSSLKPELRLAEADPSDSKKNLPLLEQIKIERDVISTPEARATDMVSAAKPAAAAGQTFDGKKVRVGGVQNQTRVEGQTLAKLASAAPAQGGKSGAPSSAPVRVTAADATTGTTAGGEVIQLSTFSVSSTRDFAANTMAGSRLPIEGPAFKAQTDDASRLRVSGYEVSVDKESVNRMRPIAAAPPAEQAGLVATVTPGFPFMPELPAPRESVTFTTESYAYQNDNAFLAAAQNPFSTFSIDVDTASYANVRRFIQGGRLPPADAVRIEEMVNYFPYRYAAPTGEVPFAATMEVASAPWAPTHRLVRIGLKGREISTEARPAANLVFLLDVSGSMNQPNKLPLVKESMRLLVGKLRADDRVAIVTYAGHSGLALPSTPAGKSREILEALDALTSGGSTNGAMGIQLAYDIAKANLVTGGLNRVILCTDGDFNVGVTSEGELTRLVEEKAKSGVFLTVLGFGMGNLKDSTLEKLADKGNGNYGYIDTRREAEKLLVEQVNGTLLTLAKDVKLQVDFNPAKVASYRLIGYENRVLKREDFNNDKIDAGEIGAGHAVTALYEIVPVGAAEKTETVLSAVDESKYQAAKATGVTAKLPASIANELLTLKVRYKEPAGEVSQKLEFPLVDGGALFATASPDFKFAAAVAAFGMILRDSPHKGSVTIGDIIAWAGTGVNDDVGGYRGEFINLVNAARLLMR